MPGCGVKEENTMSKRIVATPAAIALIRQLTEEYGPLMFHQSGGCCDGSVPLCFKQGEFRVGSRDVLLGVIEGAPFYAGAAQYPYLAKTQLVLDAIEGDLDSFSLEAGSGVRFISRSNACLNPEETNEPGR
jgi:uncharacterized protein (DUF779 family)